MSDDTLDDPMDALDGEGGPEEAGTDGDVADADDGDDGPADEAAEGAAVDGEDRVAALEERLADRDDRIEELESRLKRVQADFENYKKRAERKREEFAKYATVDLISELLGVRDDLDRALDSDGDVREGVELVAEELDGILRDEGVERIEAEGAPDPERHEVMMQVASPDHEEGEIVEVYEPGYRMDDRVIRPAKVTVASGEEGDEGDEGDEGEEGEVGDDGDGDDGDG